MEHHLKCEKKYYHRTAAGLKMFEVRLNDRDYQVGDILVLREWDEAGRDGLDKYVNADEAVALRLRVTYILVSTQYLAKDFVVLGTEFEEPARREIEIDLLAVIRSVPGFGLANHECIAMLANALKTALEGDLS